MARPVATPFLISPISVSTTLDQWGSSLLGLCTLDPMLSPPSTPEEICQRKVLRGMQCPKNMGETRYQVPKEGLRK